MNSKEILYHNKLIANFMDDDINYRHHQPIKDSFIYFQKNNKEFNTWIIISSSKDKNGIVDYYFNNSYDWLIPVVKKIHEIKVLIYESYYDKSHKLYKLSQKFHNNDMIMDYMMDFEELHPAYPIEDIYNLCVEFIKWYNKATAKK